MQLMTMVDVELLTKPGCHLCEEARPIVRRVCAAAGARLTERDIGAEPELFERYRDLIPVVLVNGRQTAHWHVDEDSLTAAIVSVAS